MLYVLGVFIAGLFIIPIFWYIFHSLYWSVQPATVAIAEDLGTNSTRFYQVDTFFQNFENWLHVIALLVLGLFGIVYIQRRGERV